MSNNEVIINQKEHTDIYDWLSVNVMNYKEDQKHYTLTSEGKINVYWNLLLHDDVTQIKYPFGYVKGDFDCSICRINSLIGVPEKIDGYFGCENCKKIISFIGFPKIINKAIQFDGNNFSNDPKYKEKYKLYLAMWLELFESVNNEERLEYINSYKYKTDIYNQNPIIPVEIMKEYGF
jgi:hypothetical protein